MWIPKTTAELEEAVRTGSVEESAHLDFKRDLPTKSLDLAKDVAAMANEGGVIIFGVGEDEHHRPAALSPVSLPGEAERIDSRIKSAIQETPYFRLQVLASAENPASGYIVLIVPPSERAPHMVVAGGHNRYYRRSAKTNEPMNEGEVARLYERRKSWEVDREAVFDKVIAMAPEQQRDGSSFLHLFLLPLSQSLDLLGSHLQKQLDGELLRDLFGEAQNQGERTEENPSTHTISRPRRVDDGWCLELGVGAYGSRHGTALVCVRHDGLATLFWDETCFIGQRSTFESESVQCRYLRDRAVNSWITCMVSIAGSLYRELPYSGQVDVGISLTGMKGAAPASKASRYPSDEPRSFQASEYRETTRVSAEQLLTEPRSVTRKLLRRLLHALELDPGNRSSND